MKLIYINSLGDNHKGEYIYEFIFGDGDVNDEIWGEGWDEVPANSYPKPPEMKYIKQVYLLQTPKVVLELIQDSIYLSMYDAVDGIVSLAWEDYETCPEDKTRLHFKFSEDYESVSDKLYERDLILKDSSSYEI